MRHAGLVLAVAVLVSIPTVAQAQPDHATDWLLVKLAARVETAALPTFGRPRIDVGISSVDAVLAALDVQVVERLLPPAPAHGRALAEALGLDRWCVVRLAEGTDLDAAASSLAALGDVEAVQLDGRGEGAQAPNDPSFGTQWHLKNVAHPGADIHALGGWTWSQGSASVVVAILDSGGDWDHPDLASRIWSNPGEIAANGVDDDANGYVDDIRGWDFVNNDNNPMDDHGHGTNVAGIVGAATNNGLGVAGVDWNCRLMLAKNLNASNSGFYSWWTASIYYAANNGARVLNMSEGGLSFDAAMRDAVDYAHGLGALVCAAMMNANSATVYYPVNFTNTIGVGATNNLDQRAVPFCWGGGSSYGPHIELVAPGNLIYSTLWNDTYGSYCGTSQATPQVSAAAALLWGIRPNLTNAMVRDFLLTTADDQVGNPAEDTPGFDHYYGHGRLNLETAGALAALVGVEPAPTASGLGISIAPNPAGHATTLRYRIPTEGRLDVDVYDLAGRRVAGMVRPHAATGSGALELDTSGLGAGVYMVRFAHRGSDAAASRSVTRRIAVVR